MEAGGAAPELRVLEDPAQVVADRLFALARVGGEVALSGGSTPQRAYELASQRNVDWSKLTLWFGDDRAVGPDHPDSNYRMVADAWLNYIPERRRPRVMRVEGERGWEGAADHYEGLMRDELGERPQFDYALMGLGPDGHTASLFPGQPTLQEAARFVVGVPEAGMEPWLPRVSLTLPVFNAAREVVFLVSGEAKAPAVARAFGRPPDRTAPAALVRPAHGRLQVLLDPPAARQL